MQGHGAKILCRDAGRVPWAGLPESVEPRGGAPGSPGKTNTVGNMTSPPQIRAAPTGGWSPAAGGFERVGLMMAGPSREAIRARCSQFIGHLEGARCIKHEQRRRGRRKGVLRACPPRRRLRLSRRIFEGICLWPRRWEEPSAGVSDPLWMGPSSAFATGG